MPAPGIEHDGIRVSHTLQVCKPIPEVPFSMEDETKPHTDCGNFLRDLKDFPENSPTTFKNGKWHAGKSEMVEVFLRLDNYPGSGGVDFFLTYVPTQTRLFAHHWDLPRCGGNCSWSWWYQWIDMVWGRFPGEMNMEGLYQVYLSTTWGDVSMFFEVVDSSIQEKKLATLEKALAELKDLVTKGFRRTDEAIIQIYRDIDEKISGMKDTVLGWVEGAFVGIVEKVLEQDVKK